MTQGKRHPSQPDRKRAPQTPRGKQGPLPEPPPSRPPRGGLPFDVPRVSLEDDELPSKEPDDRPTGIVTLDTTQPLPSLEDDDLPVKEPDDRPTCVVVLDTTQPLPSLEDDGPPVKQPDAPHSGVVTRDTTQPVPSLEDDGLPGEEPDDQPTGIFVHDSTQPLPSLEDDDPPVKEPDDRPTGVVSLDDVLPPFSLEDSSERAGPTSRARSHGAGRGASIHAAGAPAAVEHGKRDAAPKPPAAPATFPASPPRAPASPAAGPAKLSREAPPAKRPPEAEPVPNPETVKGPEESTGTGPLPSPPSPPEPASPLSRKPGAYSRTQSGTHRAVSPRPAAAAETEAAVAPIDPAVQRRLVVAGAVAACVLVSILVYAFFISTSRPSSEELWVLYPTDERSGRLAPPSPYQVEFEYLGATPCTKNGSPDCLLYEYSYRSFTGRMAVRPGASGWERVDTAPEATPP